MALQLASEGYTKPTTDASVDHNVPNSIISAELAAICQVNRLDGGKVSNAIRPLIREILANYMAVREHDKVRRTRLERLRCAERSPKHHNDKTNEQT